MKYILLTCDTEVGELHADRLDAFEVFIEGKVQNQEVGVKLINSIASEYGAIVEHFVDVYPYERYGEEKFKSLCNNIINSGHKIGLHTHPSGKYDPKRKYMWQYSLDEQKEIIKFGKEKIKEWTGIDVKSHRAGGYGADNNTLRALKEDNILIDSSFFYMNEKCKINYNFLNKPSLINEVFEIPVSVYKLEKSVKILNLKNISYQKLDFRYGSNVKEILKCIDVLNDNSVVVLFLHSFNFLNLLYDCKENCYKKITINNNLIEEYDNLLKEIRKRNDCLFIHSEDLLFKELCNLDIVPEIKRNVNIFNVIKQKISNKFKNRNFI